MDLGALEPPFASGLRSKPSHADLDAAFDDGETQLLDELANMSGALLALSAVRFGSEL